jgi:hypothetical protein
VEEESGRAKWGERAGQVRSRREAGGQLGRGIVAEAELHGRCGGSEERGHLAVDVGSMLEWTGWAEWRRWLKRVQRGFGRMWIRMDGPGERARAVEIFLVSVSR